MNFYNRMMNSTAYAANNEGGGGGSKETFIPGIDDDIGKAQDAAVLGTNETNEEQTNDDAGADQQAEQQQDQEAEDNAQQQADEQLTPEQLAQQRKTDGTQQQRQTEQVRIPAQKHVDYNYDAKGNVVNPRDGKVIYAAGSDANILFRSLQNERFRTHKLNQEKDAVIKAGRQIEAQYAALKDANTMGDRLGLAVPDQVEAMTLAANYKKNPIEAVRYMLTEAVKDGVDLKQILKGVDTIQTDGIKKLLDERLKPITDRDRQTNENATRVRQIEEKVEQEWNSLLSEYPEAELHTDALTNIVNQSTKTGENFSIPQAFMRLQRFAMDNRLDLRKPLKPQLEAQRGTARKPQQQNRQALPSSSRKPFNARTNEDAGRNSFEMSSKDIVAEALRENGYNLPS